VPCLIRAWNSLSDIRDGNGLKVLSVFGHDREYATVCLRKPENEEVETLFSTIAIIKVIKSSIITFIGYVSRMEIGAILNNFVEQLEEGKAYLGKQY
jgi:hypothetical protein